MEVIDLPLTRVMFKRVLKMMGNRFEFIVVAGENQEAWANRCIDLAIQEVNRIEKLFTTFDDNSQTNQVNRYAGEKPVVVDREVIDLVLRAQRISDLTQGAFDLSYGSIDKRLWNFDRNMTSLPEADIAKKIVRLINYKNIIINQTASTIYLAEKGMRIGFGGIGKGYAAERAKQVLRENGVANGIVNAAGDLTAWGYQPDGKPWTIGIADPRNAWKPFSYLEITGMAVATSGNYEKYVMIDGKRYSHTIDPKTGLPVHGIKSVTLISPNAEVCDAMATPVMIMGVKVGMNLINQVKGVACIIIDENDNIYTSKNIRLQ